MTPVTVLGLGAMGQALAQTFLDNGHPTTVWNRSPGRADDLAARGVTLAGSVAEAVAASPLIVVCVLNYAAVHEILDPGALRGKAVVNLTTGTPRQARDTAEWIGDSYVDGGIMAVPSMIGRPEAFILYSGSGGAFAEHERTLGELGAARYAGEDPGRASLLDVALLSAMYGMFGGYFHAVAMVGADKVPAAEFTPMVTSWLNAMMASLPAMAKAIDSGEHSTTESSLAMQAAGFGTLLEASRDQGVSTELVEPMRVLLDRGVAAGLGDTDTSSLVELLASLPRSGNCHGSGSDGDG